MATLTWSAWTSGHRVSAQAQITNSNQQLISELRQHVKHVFVIYQENHSFDEYFGTYPGGTILRPHKRDRTVFGNTIPLARNGLHRFS